MEKEEKQVYKLIFYLESRTNALERIKDHKKCFNFKEDLLSYGSTIFDDFENMVSLSLLGTNDVKMTYHANKTFLTNHFARRLKQY